MTNLFINNNDNENSYSVFEEVYFVYWISIFVYDFHYLSDTLIWLIFKYYHNNTILSDLMHCIYYLSCVKFHELYRRYVTGIYHLIFIYI